ncbi:MAG: outer membrane protein transport protein [Gammaproteobacteria bacterium]|jgi:long-chain fatty acid transport protein|nr:outer membrane protein transport protein [Gammaproteobacteria bacterium]
MTGAVNGYFLMGYSPKYIGVGGMGVAHPQDSMAASINPAGTALVAPGWDFNLRFMHPQRAAEVDCTGIGGCDRPVADRSTREFFVVPAFGFVRRVAPGWSVGLSVYANGGLNTTYSRALFNEATARILGGNPADPGFPVRDKLGVDFSQLIFAPSLAWQASDRLTLGLAPLFAVQRFAAFGIQGFAPLSSDATSLSNRSTEYSLGIGTRIGAIVELTPGLRLGAQYTSRIFTQRYTRYNGLFPDGGELDGPPHYTVGIAWDVTPRWTLGFDFQQIQFATVEAIGNPGPTAAELIGNITPARRLGGPSGIGFGWRNQSVYKAGIIYRPTGRLVWRLGWNYGEGQIPREETLINLLMPGLLEHHITGGMSYTFAHGGEMSLGYMHGFTMSQRDPQSDFLGAPVSAWSQGDGLDVSYSRRF